MSEYDIRIVIKAKSKPSAIMAGGGLEMDKIKHWLEDRLDESYLFEYSFVSEIMELSSKRRVRKLGGQPKP